MMLYYHLYSNNSNDKYENNKLYNNYYHHTMNAESASIHLKLELRTGTSPFNMAPKKELRLYNDILCYKNFKIEKHHRRSPYEVQLNYTKIMPIAPSTKALGLFMNLMMMMMKK